jgi:hypothetical protein
MYRANYPVDNPSDYWKISIYIVLFSGRDIKASSRQRGTFFLFASYLNHVSLLNLTLEIVDRLFNAYQTDLPRKVDSVDEVGRWKIRWALVDKPETTRHSTCNKPWLIPGYIYIIICILLTLPLSSATSERSLRRVKSYLRSTIGDEWPSNLSLIHIHRHVQVDMIIDDFS